MSIAQLVFIPLLFEDIEQRGYGIVTIENWKQLTGYSFPRVSQQFYIREFGKMVTVITANLQRNELMIGYVK